MLRRFEVADDSGMMAVIDPDAYLSHVGWQDDLDVIGAHFVTEMARRTMLIWPTGWDDIWPVEVTDEPRVFHQADVRRQYTGLIRCSRGRLLVTSYASLTMAATYADSTLPPDHENDQVIALPRGLHTCQATLLWPVRDEDEDLDHEDPDAGDGAASRKFVLVFTPGGDIPPWSQAPWDRADYHDG